MEDRRPWAELIRSLQSVENKSRRERLPLDRSKAKSWEGEARDRTVNKLMLGDWAVLI